MMNKFDSKSFFNDSTYRFGDDDDIIVMENINKVPSEAVSLDKYGILVFCIKGRVQFDYDGVLINLNENDFFLYQAHSVVSNFMASSDCNCRLIWFTRSELWNINLYAGTSLYDLTQLKLSPIVHLTDNDVELLDSYFKLLCKRMKDLSPSLHSSIVRSLLGTMMLELLSMMRRVITHNSGSLPDAAGTSTHKKVLVDKFIRMVEQSDGRVRKVDDFANRLNITSKYLSKIVKEVLNRNPSVYIQLFTMKAIENRLRLTDMTMQEIANDLNFPNPSFFSKFFREHSGMTPQEYRLKHQGVK